MTLNRDFLHLFYRCGAQNQAQKTPPNVRIFRTWPDQTKVALDGFEAMPAVLCLMSLQPSQNGLARFIDNRQLIIGTESTTSA